MKPIQFVAAGVGLYVCIFSFAAARSAYGSLLSSQYKLEKDPITKKAGCQFCHSTAFGGRSWNKFGDSIRTQFDGAASRKIQDALYLVLKENKDSDNDGYGDALEVVAKTLPGDAKSKPSAPVADIEEQLKKLGGIDVFKPVVTK
jgi:hypothetical protein